MLLIFRQERKKKANIWAHTDVKKNCLKLISVYHQRRDLIESKLVLTGFLQKRHVYLHEVLNRILLVSRYHVFTECCLKLWWLHLEERSPLSTAYHISNYSEGYTAGTCCHAPSPRRINPVSSSRVVGASHFHLRMLEFSRENRQNLNTLTLL